MSPKIKSPYILKKLCSVLKDKGEKIVFTNGCFDILHSGHIRYLTEAKKKGDTLIVALNSDRSVKKIKGEKRPIVPLKERLQVVAALQMVDYVTFFHESTPYQLISLLKPNILIKGGDWKTNEIIGSDVVLKNGGSVKSLQYYGGKSTTHIIRKIVRLYS